MGFIITNQITLPNGLSSQNIQVSINGAYQISRPINFNLDSPPTYNVSYNYLMFLNRNEPIQYKNESFNLESVNGLNIYTEIYNRLKGKFSGCDFVDN